LTEFYRDLIERSTARALTRALLAWYSGARRDLPWRHTRDPYRIWVSEIMLRREPRGLLGGLWELPGIEIEPDASPQSALQRQLSKSLGAAAIGESLATVAHAYSHFRVRVTAFGAEMVGRPEPSTPWDQARFVAPTDLPDYGLTGVTLKIIRLLGWDQARDAGPSRRGRQRLFPERFPLMPGSVMATGSRTCFNCSSSK